MQHLPAFLGPPPPRWTLSKASRAVLKASRTHLGPSSRLFGALLARFRRAKGVPENASEAPKLNGLAPFSFSISLFGFAAVFDTVRCPSGPFSGPLRALPGPYWALYRVPFRPFLFPEPPQHALLFSTLRLTAADLIKTQAQRRLQSHGQFCGETIVKLTRAKPTLLTSLRVPPCRCRSDTVLTRLVWLRGRWTPLYRPPLPSRLFWAVFGASQGPLGAFFVGPFPRFFGPSGAVLDPSHKLQGPKMVGRQCLPPQGRSIERIISASPYPSSVSFASFDIFGCPFGQYSGPPGALWELSWFLFPRLFGPSGGVLDPSHELRVPKVGRRCLPPQGRSIECIKRIKSINPDPLTPWGPGAFSPSQPPRSLARPVWKGGILLN